MTTKADRAALEWLTLDLRFRFEARGSFRDARRQRRVAVADALWRERQDRAALRHLCRAVRALRVIRAQAEEREAR